MNITPDSFYDGGRYHNDWDIIKHAGQLLEQGATILDMGAASSRPGSELIKAGLEQERLLPAIEVIIKNYPDAVISIDTYNASTAREAIAAGAHIINDISAGSLDPLMFETIAQLKVPYIIMHMQGTPENMQINPTYEDPVKEITFYFSQKIVALHQLGVHDIIIDPGFGFGKSLQDNYILLHKLEYFKILEVPILVGLSRKSLINKVLGISPQQALNGTTVLNTIALQKGANILRVHDAKQAREIVEIVKMFEGLD